MSPVLRPGPAATVHELHTAQALDALRRTELARVRAAAASWRNGIGGLLAAVAGFGIVKGRSDIGELTPPWARAVGVLLLLALVIGTAGALSLIRAATGWLRLLPMDEFHSPRTTSMSRPCCRCGRCGAASRWPWPGRHCWSPRSPRPGTGGPAGRVSG
ncbi:hypothetical protein ACFQY4_25175 [Catellatospora bangladeshensis]|uniref:hypothetical protein n=1 Tax=Catellatospora bangladeshensis TaxID=310355 RepID=UPI00361B5045